MEIVESERVELKSRVTERICKTIAAFANTVGGSIYIGIDDFGRVVGVEGTDAEMLRISSLVRDRICPELIPFVSVEPVDLGGKRCIRVIVEPGDEKPYYLASRGLIPGGVFTRIGPATVPVDRRGIRRMIREADGDSFESRHAVVQELTFDEAEQAFRRQGLAFEEPQFKTLGLLAADGFYSNLALLLSDQCPYTIKCAVFNDDFGTEFITRKECGGSVLRQVNEAADFLDASNRLRSTFSGLQRVDRRDYPEQAIREALLNAVIHQDYDGGASPLIKMYRDRLEFQSYGGLVGSLTLDDALEGFSLSRNPRLMQLFHRLGIVEAYGTGLPAIRRLYEGTGLKPLISVGAVFSVSLPNVNTTRDSTKTLTANYGESARFGADVARRDDAASVAGADVATGEHRTGLAFSWEESPRLLVEFANTCESFTRGEAQQVLGAGRDVTLQVLNGLVESGELKREGRARATRYRIA